uniref:ACT domain-containing protein ACR n=1 Tax=Salix viminalis TaxID=40686 RepID=A0A6N2K339_SALVM
MPVRRAPMDLHQLWTWLQGIQILETGRMENVCWPYFDPDFDSLPERIFGPTLILKQQHIYVVHHGIHCSCRVCIDNESMEDCTVVKIDSVNKQGLLLEVVQVLTDLNLTISKGYISSDAGWFMDGKESTPSPPNARAYTNNVFEAADHSGEHTAIEMSGTDRPGLFSEISAALADLHCNIVEPQCSASLCRLHLRSILRTQLKPRLASIEDHLITVLRANTVRSAGGPSQISNREVKTGGFLGGEGAVSNVERRLHQLMLSVRDFDGPRSPSAAGSGLINSEGGSKMVVSIENCDQKEYSIVNIECKDRPRLMFDTICTLNDMQYVIFHASVSSDNEYFIRHSDGYALHTESEKERVIKCLEAAIERRVSEGVLLRLRAENRLGLLSDITRVLRENGLAVVRADVATQGEKAVNAFYVRDISGNEVDMGFIKSMKKEMGLTDLEVITTTTTPARTIGNISPHERHRFSFGDLLKSQIERFSHNFVAIN